MESPIDINAHTVPEGLKWSSKKAETSAKNNSYTYVTLREGGKTSDRKLSGAEKHWTSNDVDSQNTIYVPKYRIAGTPEAVRQALLKAGEKSTDVEAAISGAYSRNNYKGALSGQFAAEIENAKGSSNKSNETFSKEFLENIRQAMKNKEYEVVGKNKKKKTSPRKSPAKRKAPEPRRVSDPAANLREKLDRLKQGQVLDVTKMSNEGKNVKIINPPRKCTAGKFGLLTMAPIVSKDINKYRYALQLLYGQDFVRQNDRNIGLVAESIRRGGILPSGACNLVNGISVDNAYSPPRRQPSPAGSGNRSGTSPVFGSGSGQNVAAQGFGGSGSGQNVAAQGFGGSGSGQNVVPPVFGGSGSGSAGRTGLPQSPRSAQMPPGRLSPRAGQGSAPGANMVTGVAFQPAQGVAATRSPQTLGGFNAAQMGAFRQQ